jgi:fatty acid desaturase
VIIAEAVRWVVGRRRSKLLWRAATVAVVVGSLPLLLAALLPLLLGGSVGSIVGILIRGLYTVLVTSSFYYRLTGIQLGR